MKRISLLSFFLFPLFSASSALAESTTQKILSHQGSDFSLLSQKIQAEAKPTTGMELLKLARDRSQPEFARYKALSIAVRILPQTRAETELRAFLRDSSWMLRSAALRELAVSGSAGGGEDAMKLLRDPAWVVRSQAIHTVVALKPTGMLPALLVAAADPTNFHGGRAQWVAYRALDAAIALKPTSKDLFQLRPALIRGEDEAYLKRIISLLERSTGKSIPSPSSTGVRALAMDWSRELAKIATNDAVPATRNPAKNR